MGTRLVEQSISIVSSSEQQALGRRSLLVVVVVNHSRAALEYIRPSGRALACATAAG
jgi:hypothetical protein